MSSAEVEIESLKTVIVALNEKVKVLESVQDDVKNKEYALNKSEEARGELQHF